MKPRGWRYWAVMAAVLAVAIALPLPQWLRVGAVLVVAVALS